VIGAGAVTGATGAGVLIGVGVVGATGATGGVTGVVTPFRASIACLAVHCRAILCKES